MTGLPFPPEMGRRYDTWLERKGVAFEQRPHCRKWLRFYWDFCHQYAFQPTKRQSFPAFHEKLRKMLRNRILKVENQLPEA